MKLARLKIPWPEGLHLRPAGRLVALGRAVHSSISFRVNERVADARSVLSLMLLCASLGSVLEIEVAGEDEEAALAAVLTVFQSEDGSSPSAVDRDHSRPS